MSGGPGTIPRRIIQTWKSASVPFPFTRFSRRLRDLHPAFDYRLFSDDDADAFVRERYPQHVEGWRALQTPIERADLFRVLAVHGLGGFYFDLDVVMTHPVDALLDHACVFPFEHVADAYSASMYGVLDQLGQYAFGAVAGHPLLAHYAENICAVALGHAPPPPEEIIRRHPSPSDVVRVIMSTGPGMLARTLGEHPDLGAGVHVVSAVDRRTGKRLPYCFGPFGSHAMLGTFGWRVSGRGGLHVTLRRYGAWLRSIRDASARATIVGRCELGMEEWSERPETRMTSSS
jgi:hypothetical protein